MVAVCVLIAFLSRGALESVPSFEMTIIKRGLGPFDSDLNEQTATWQLRWIGNDSTFDGLKMALNSRKMEIGAGRETLVFDAK